MQQDGHKLLRRTSSRKGRAWTSQTNVAKPKAPSRSRRESILSQRPERRASKIVHSSTTDSSVISAATHHNLKREGSTATRSSALVERGSNNKTPNRDLWAKVRAAVKLTSAIGRMHKESDGARRKRIRRHWDIARQIARAAMSLSTINNKRADADSHVGIRDYTRFIKLLGAHPSARTDNDLNFMMKSTAHLAIFKGAGSSAPPPSSNQNPTPESLVSAEISESQHREICRTMTIRKLSSSHEFVFRQGDTGEEFFIILEGSVLVQRDVNNSGVAHTVAKLEAGGSFGEIALSSKFVVRTASVVTLEPCLLLVIHKDDYQRILQNTHQEIFDRKIRFLKLVPAFQDLTEKEVFNLCVSLHTYRVRAGSSVVREGDLLDPLRFFIIVKRGELEVRKLARKSMQSTNKIDSKTIMNSDKVLTLCLMGPSESICDHHSLHGREDLDYRYPFTVVANTLCEYYCISKHDLFGKLSRISLANVQKRISKFPDERLVRNALAASIGWKEYKADLIAEILSKKELRGPAGFNQLSPSYVPETRISRRRNVDFELDKPTRPTPKRPTIAYRKNSSGGPRGSTSGPRTRISCFERARRASGVDMDATSHDSDDNEDASVQRKAYTCVSQVYSRSQNTEEQPEVINIKNEAACTGTYGELNSLERAHMRSKRREALRKRLAEGAHELDEFLQDGMELTRHVYENALSHGARYYCRSLALTTESDR